MSKSTSKKPSKPTQAARVSSKSKTTRPASKAKKTTTKQLTTAALRTWNFIFSGLLLAQATALILLSNKERGDVSLYANYITRDPVASDSTGQTIMAQAADQLVSVNLVYLVAAFLTLGALISLLVASRYRASYDQHLKSGSNKLRWVGYSFSLSSLILTAALIAGVSDVASLAALAILVIIGSTLAYKTEQQRLSLPSVWLNRLTLLTAAAPIVIIIKYIASAHFYGGGLPLKTLAVLGVLGFGLLVTFLALANTYKANPKAAQYLVVERVYLVFGFLVPSAFAWAIFSLLLK